MASHQSLDVSLHCHRACALGLASGAARIGRCQYCLKNWQRKANLKEERNMPASQVLITATLVGVGGTLIVDAVKGLAARFLGKMPTHSFGLSLLCSHGIHCIKTSRCRCYFVQAFPEARPNARRSCLDHRDGKCPSLHNRDRWAIADGNAGSHDRRPRMTA